MTYKDIEIVDTSSMKSKPRSGNYLGSLTATNKNMKKKQTWMGRKKSVQQTQPEEFKGSFQNKGKKKEKKFESEESFEYYPPVQQSRLKKEPSKNEEVNMDSFSHNQVIMQYQAQI